jgi:hypothetical protein
MRDGCVSEAACLLVTAFAVTHRPAALLAQLQPRRVARIASVASFNACVCRSTNFTLHRTCGVRLA